MLMRLLEEKGATVCYHDPHVPVIRLTREHPQYAGRRSVPVTPEGYDLALISTAHDEYRRMDFSGWRIPVVDTRNCVTRRPSLYYRA
jgi:UDP-N-acetyl-D-glucosamine dehydrogenase